MSGSTGVRIAFGGSLMLAAACIGSASQQDKPQGRKSPAPVQSAPEAGDVATAPALGWGDHIAWRHLDEGLEAAKASDRPLMLVVHASWCGQCRKLKPSFEDRELAELTRHFVMVNADQDEVPAVLRYAPDGAYLPRVVFLSPGSGEVDASLSNTRRSQQRYYYGPRDDLVGSMRKALAAHGKS